MTQLQSFLSSHFPSLILRPALFYSWTPSLRFEIGPPAICFREQQEFYINEAFERANTLFRRLFQAEDDILLVTDVYAAEDHRFLQAQPLHVYGKYVKARTLLAKLTHEKITTPPDDEGTYHQFVLACQIKQFRTAALLKAILHEDFHHPSTLLKRDRYSRYEVYIINIHKRLIFHLYDDHGCDVIASDKETIRYLYHDFNDWLLDYDRGQMDEVFGNHETKDSCVRK